jgi:CheY-like chemotaxis protein
LVSAHSDGVGHGSLFRVDLPRASERDAVTQPSEGPAGASSDATSIRPGKDEGSAIDERALLGVRVLLVDDHEDVLEVQRRLLCDCGASVTTAQSGAQALRFLAHEHFDVLLSDLGMPGMDGYELVRLVRNQLGIAAEHMPAVAVTAYVRVEDRELALQDGYQAVIQKPVDPQEFARRVIRLLSDAAACTGGSSAL